MSEPPALSPGRLAERLRELHHGARPLLLANAWDVASARVVAQSGFSAVATTSAGVAAALGYGDGEVMPAEVAFTAVARIAAAVTVPVTADLEAGYGLDPHEVIRRLLASGAVGLNYEDTDHRRGGLVPADVQATRLGALRAAAGAAGVEVVINARTDPYLAVAQPGPRELEEAIERGRRYREAGADCIYPIGALDEASIATLVAAIGGPVNVLAVPGGPSPVRLAELGVARISLGARLAREAMAWLRGRLDELAPDLESRSG